MKKLLFILKLFFFAFICSAQEYITVSPDEWSSMTQTSPFDGTIREAFIMGSCDNLPDPFLIINRTANEPIHVFLTSLQIVHGNATVEMKFDYEIEKYKLVAIYSNIQNTIAPGNGYVIRFDPQTLSIENFIKKLQIGNTLYVRLYNGTFYVGQIDFSLNGADEALEILEK